MSYDGNGTYNPPTPAYPAIPNTVISSNDYNTVIDDLAAALSIAWPRDGQAAATGQMSMGGFKLTSLAKGTNGADATNVLQVFVNPSFSATTLTGVEVNGTAFTVNVTTIRLTAATADLSTVSTLVLPPGTTIGDVTAAELAYLSGLTDNVQALLDLKANLAGGNTFTGLQTLEAQLAGTSSGVTQLPSDNTTALATTQFVQQVSMNAALPGQSGSDGRFLKTDGVNATWQYNNPDLPLAVLGII